MNTVPAKLSTFRVERVGSRSVRVRKGYITYFTDQWYTNEVPEYTFEDVGDGYWQIWLKGTWAISRKINYCPVVNGLPEAGYGMVNHTSYDSVSWEYIITTNLESDLGRGPTSDYLWLQDQEYINPLIVYSASEEVFYLPICRVDLIDDRIKIYQNCNTMCYIPHLKKQYFHHYGDL